jgi:hypothetical protein
LVLVAALGIDGNRDKHPLGLAKGAAALVAYAAEHAATKEIERQADAV